MLSNTDMAITTWINSICDALSLLYLVYKFRLKTIFLIAGTCIWNMNSLNLVLNKNVKYPFSNKIKKWSGNSERNSISNLFSYRYVLHFKDFFPISRRDIKKIVYKIPRNLLVFFKSCYVDLYYEYQGKDRQVYYGIILCSTHERIVVWYWSRSRSWQGCVYIHNHTREVTQQIQLSFTYITSALWLTAKTKQKT